MEKRHIVIGSYDTTDFWTLTGCTLEAPTLRTNYVEVPGRNGFLDLSTATTDGEPVYSDRSLTITLESSEGTKTERDAEITKLYTSLDGYRVNIVLPDENGYYRTGRCTIGVDYSNLAHAALTITATVTPLRTKNAESSIYRTLSTSQVSFTVTNNGRPVVPSIAVESETAIVFGDTTTTLSAGTWTVPAIRLANGANTIKAKATSGTGKITLTWHEVTL